MSDSGLELASGYLFEDVRGRAASDVVLETEGFSRKTESTGNRWERYTYTTVRPLPGDDSQENGPFLHDVICRRHDARVLVLARSRTIVSVLMREHLNAAFANRLQRVPIEIERLVLDLISPEKEFPYILCQAYANANEYANALESISFYGNNLSYSNIFHSVSERKNVRFYACGLKLKSTGVEVLKASSAGGVTFPRANEQGLHDGLAALSFLSDQGYTRDQSMRF